MPEKHEIDHVVKWCCNVMEERKRVYCIEPNPFREEFDWTYRFPYIEINVPIEKAKKHNLVFDGRTKTLWQYLNNTWQKIEEDFTIE